MKNRNNEKGIRAIALFSIYLMISLTVVSAYAMRTESYGSEDGMSEALIKFFDFLLPSVSAAEGLPETLGGQCVFAVKIRALSDASKYSSTELQKFITDNSATFGGKSINSYSYKFDDGTSAVLYVLSSPTTPKLSEINKKIAELKAKPLKDPRTNQEITSKVYVPFIYDPKSKTYILSDSAKALDFIKTNCPVSTTTPAPIQTGTPAASTEAKTGLQQQSTEVLGGSCAFAIKILAAAEASKFSSEELQKFISDNSATFGGIKEAIKAYPYNFDDGKPGVLYVLRSPTSTQLSEINKKIAELKAKPLKNPRTNQEIANKVYVPFVYDFASKSYILYDSSRAPDFIKTSCKIGTTAAFQNEAPAPAKVPATVVSEKVNMGKKNKSVEMVIELVDSNGATIREILSGKLNFWGGRITSIDIKSQVTSGTIITTSRDEVSWDLSLPSAVSKGSEYVSKHPGPLKAVREKALEILNYKTEQGYTYPQFYALCVGNEECRKNILPGLPNPSVLLKFVNDANRILQASVLTNEMLPLASAAETAVQTRVRQASEYYGGYYYFPQREEQKAYNAGYMAALKGWYEAQGGIGGFILNQFKALGKGFLVGLVWEVMGLSEVSKYLSVQYYIKAGICYYAAPAIGGQWDKCMKAKYIVPALTCALQTSVHGQVLSKDACLPSTPQAMGVPTGYQNCERCHTDSFPCTPARCQALSADSSCVYDAYAEKCFPDPEKIKNCDKTSGTALSVTHINNITITSTKQYSKNNITYGDVSFDVELKTNLASECRFTLNKTEGWSNMKKMTPDQTFQKHAVSIDISDPLRKTYFYYVLCQDSCRQQVFSPIVEMRLEKDSKPDTEGPIVIEKFPLPDMPIEGGLNGKRETSIIVKTDEPSECKYKRWPIAESLESFVGTVEQIERVATTLVGAGADEQTLESELSLTGLDYNDANLTIMDPGSNQYTLEHSVNFTGKKALNNSEIYAFVILCKDQSGNLGEIPGIVRFKVSVPFDVEIEEPDDTMEPQPTIEVSSEKSSTCGYSVDVKQVYTNMTVFESTGFTDHSSVIDKILSYGQHKLYVTCFDDNDLNIASDEKTFSVLRDNQAPQIIRAYKDADTLFIATNELTACQYSVKQFSYGQGSEMTDNSPTSKTHRADWRYNTVYYIKCKDRFGNELSSTLRTTKTNEVSA